MMFSKSKDDTPVTPNSITKNDKRSERRSSSASAPSIIGSDVELVGNLTTIGEVQLDGIVEGDVKCGSLVLGDHGTVTGSVVADTVIVRGRVEGTIHARLVRLEKSARIKGDVYHETLSVEAGATIEGTFSHADSAGEEKAKKAIAARNDSRNSNRPGTGSQASAAGAAGTPVSGGQGQPGNATPGGPTVSRS